jgi:hypothetical protein
MTDDPKSPAIIKLHADENSPEAIEFFRQLGLCVTTWAFVDRRLFQIFHHCMGFDQTQSAFIYYRQRAFNSRLRMVDDAVKVFAKEIYDSEWRPLRDQTENLSHTRNIFAHQPTLRIGTAKDGKPLDIYSIHIEPYERALNKDYPGLRGKETLTVDDLIAHRAETENLEWSLDEFAWRVGGIVVERKAKKTGA